ncbi:MAG: helix-turn-helix domain-containing protein [Patescibacteria group bacterium]|nr:helix-turn-helix domain-containing protein [Patescibacteria group bacterium]
MTKRIPKAQQKKRGRHSKWDPRFVKMGYHLALLGATVPRMADVFGVSDATVETWMREKPDFLGALKRGRDEADAKVAKSLYRRAMGYTHRAQKIAFGKDGTPLYAPYIERYPPDTAAAVFWLKNRHPDQWKDKRVEQLENPDGSPFALNVIIESGAKPSASGDGPRTP